MNIYNNESIYFLPRGLLDDEDEQFKLDSSYFLPKDLLNEEDKKKINYKKSKLSPKAKVFVPFSTINK